MGLTVHGSIAALLTSSYHFIKSLIDLISEVHGQLVELSYLSGVLPARSPTRVVVIFCYFIVYNAVIMMKIRLKGKKE